LALGDVLCAASQNPRSWRPMPSRICEPASVTRLCGAESGACAAGPHSPWSPPFAPPTPQQLALLCSSASQLLWRSATSRARASSATAPRLPDADRPLSLDTDGQSRDIPASDAILLRVMWPSPHATLASRRLATLAAMMTRTPARSPAASSICISNSTAGWDRETNHLLS
jgi:hypothetical protein